MKDGAGQVKEHRPAIREIGAGDAPGLARYRCCRTGKSAGGRRAGRVSDRRTVVAGLFLAGAGHLGRARGHAGAALVLQILGMLIRFVRGFRADHKDAFLGDDA